MKFDVDILQQYIDQGLIERHDHTSLPISIYNYSRECVYTKKWDDITLKCRGLILDNEGNLVAKSFDKFFNIEEINPSSYPLNEDHCSVVEKEDGSLGILFYYNNEWIFSSKGSFQSDQAIKGNEILKKYNIEYLNQEYTYIFEIIYPENRIVVDYQGEEKLVLLSVFKGEHEKSILTVKMASVILGCPYSKTLKETVKINSITDINQLVTDLRADDWKNREGFILRFYPSNYRIKIKFAEYMRLHKIMTGLTIKSVFEILSNKQSPIEVLGEVPDEIYLDIDQISDMLKNEYKVFEEICRKHFVRLRANWFKNKKDKALWIQKHVDKEYRAILFNMIDKKSYESHIWKLVESKLRKENRINLKLGNII
jgi:RNA ligase